ncbi:MAG: DoxX protein [Sulfitobacter sp.]|nr:DoxX protein [Sulfitobacter sp.]
MDRLLLAAFSAAGCIQKLQVPEAAQTLLEARGLPAFLIWPAMLFNGFAAIWLIWGLWLGPLSLALAAYCMITSIFHFIPNDLWQMSIFVKNWAIAGGLLVLAEHTFGQRDARSRAVSP